RISPAALVVKVIATMRSNATPPERGSSRRTRRSISTRVLPEPAPASTQTESESVVIACLCCLVQVIVAALELVVGIFARAMTHAARVVAQSTLQPVERPARVKNRREVTAPYAAHNVDDALERILRAQFPLG